MNNEGNKSKKIRYKYTVKTNKNKKLSGFIEAHNQNEVNEFLKSEGYTVLKIEKSSVLDMKIGSKKLKYSELIFMLTQLSTYLKAGIPLIDSV